MATSRTFSKISQELKLPVTGAQSIAQGDLLVMSVNGYATKQFEPSRRFLGVAKGDANNSAGAAGAINVTVVQGTFEVSCVSPHPTNADIGKQLYLSATTGALSIASGSNVTMKVGVLESISSRTGYVWCNMDQGNAKIPQDQ